MSLTLYQMPAVDIGASVSAWIVERSLHKCLENQGDVIYYPAFFMVAMLPMDGIPRSLLVLSNVELCKVYIWLPWQQVP